MLVETIKTTPWIPDSIVCDCFDKILTDDIIHRLGKATRTGVHKISDLIRILREDRVLVQVLVCIKELAGHDLLLSCVSGSLLLVPNDFAIGPMMRKGSYDPFMMGCFVSNIQKNNVVVDVGANIGQYTTASCKTQQPSKVIAIEPHPGNLMFLKKNLQLNRCRNTEVYSVAASDTYGKRNLFSSSVNAGDHRLWNDNDENRTKFAVELNSIDSLVEPPINLMKIDTQGSETEVIKGAKNVIQNSPDLKMIVEFWPYGLEKNNSSGKELADLLFSHDFTVFHANEDEQYLSPLLQKELVEMLKYKPKHFINIWCSK